MGGLGVIIESNLKRVRLSFVGLVLGWVLTISLELNKMEELA